jgi:hypothetical protein
MKRESGDQGRRSKEKGVKKGTKEKKSAELAKGVKRTAGAVQHTSHDQQRPN